MKGKVIEVVTVHPMQPKMTVTKLCRPLPIQIKNYVELDQYNVEIRL